MANVSSSNGLENRPKLRFPGFDEPYRVTTLGAVSSLVKRTDPQSTAPIMMLSAGNGFILQSDKYSRDNAGQSLKKYILLKKGEIAYNHGASKAKQYGCCYELHEKEARIPYVYHCFKINDEEYTPYVALELNNSKMDKQLKRLVSSSVRMDGLLNISFDDYMSIKITLPCISEQRKISTFLKTLDKRIEKQRTLVEALKKYKRGLSNVLFDGLLEDSNSHLCTFGNVMTILQNNTFSRDDLSSDCDGIRNIHYGDVLIKYGALVDFRNTVIPSIRANRDISKFSESSYLQNGDVVFADTAEDYTVGKATEIIGAENVAALSGLHTIPCRPQKKFAPMYLGYYFNSDYFKRQLYPMIQGTKVSSISKSEMVKSKIIIPNMQLQSRIASILKALDDRIDAAKLTSARIIEFRKGLLQQLFI